MTELHVNLFEAFMPTEVELSTVPYQCGQTAAAIPTGSPKDPGAACSNVARALLFEQFRSDRVQMRSVMEKRLDIWDQGETSRSGEYSALVSCETDTELSSCCTIKAWRGSVRRNFEIGSLRVLSPVLLRGSARGRAASCHMTLASHVS